MKTSKYYRLDEKVGGMRGGSGKGGKTKTKWWQTTPKLQSTTTNKKWWQTKSRRLKEEAALVKGAKTPKSLTANQNRHLRKILTKDKNTSTTYVEPKNANQKAKRIKQMVNIIVSTKGAQNNSLKNIVDSTTGKFKSDAYTKLQTKLQTINNERKQTYKENFERKEKTTTMQTSLNKAEAKYRDNMKTAENKKEKKEQRTTNINLIKSAQTMGIKTIRDIEKLGDGEFKNKLTKLFNITTTTNKDKPISNKLKDLKQQQSDAYFSNKKFIRTAEKSQAEFIKERKKMNNYKSKYGTLNVLRNHSKKSHTLKKIWNITKTTGKTVVPIVPALVYGYQKTKKGIQTLSNKKKSKKTHLEKIEQLPENKKAEATKRAVEKYSTPKHMIKMNTKIKRAENLFGKNLNVLNINIDQPYSDFKKTIPKNIYTKDERQILKDYYKATKLKGMVNNNKNSITKHLQTSQEEKIDKLPLTNDKISTITNNNFKQFTPLLDIPNFNSLSPKHKILFNNENTFDKKKIELKKQLQTEYTKLQTKTEKKTENENERLKELKRLNELYKLGLNTPPHTIR